MIERVVKVCDKVICVNQNSLNDLYESRALKKGCKIANECEHILSEELNLLPNGRRFRDTKTIEETS